MQKERRNKKPLVSRFKIQPRQVRLSGGEREGLPACPTMLWRHQTLLEMEEERIEGGREGRRGSRAGGPDSDLAPSFVRLGFPKHSFDIRLEVGLEGRREEEQRMAKDPHTQTPKSVEDREGCQPRARPHQNVNGVAASLSQSGRTGLIAARQAGT